MNMNECHIRGCRNLETVCKDCGRNVCTKCLPTNEWIKFLDTPPSHLEECKVAHYLPSGDKKAGYCYSLATFLDGEFMAFNSIKKITNVTHWMCLPEPPQENTE